MLLDESVDELDDELLLTPREFGGFFEGLLELPDPSGSPRQSLWRGADDRLDGDAEDSSHLRQDVGARWLG